MSKLIKRQDVIEPIENSYIPKDDMWAMVADVEKLPVVETEDLFRDEKDNVLKVYSEEINEHMDALIGNLEWIQDECERALDHAKVLEIRYDQLKKEYKESLLEG